MRLRAPRRARWCWRPSSRSAAADRAADRARSPVSARRRERTSRILYVRSGAALKRLALEYDALAADVYWIRAIQHYGGDRLDAGAGPARRYELLYPLLDITTTLDPYFKIAYRFGAIFLSEGYPGGPGRPDQSVALLRKAIAAQPAEVAVLPRHRLRVLLAPARLPGRGRLVPARRRAARARPTGSTPVAATMLTHGRGSRRRPGFSGSRSSKSEEPWLRRAAERALAAARRAGPDGSARRAIVQRHPPPPGERYSWAALIGEARSAASRPIRPARRSRSIPATGRVTISRAVAALPDAGQTRGGPPVNLDPPQLVILRHARPRRRQLSQRLHPSHPARGSRSRTPARAVRAAATTCAGSTTSRSSATRCSAAGAGSAARPSRSGTPPSRSLTMALFVLHGVVFGWTPAPGPAAAVRLRDGGAVCHRSGAPPAARRHHAPGHRRWGSSRAPCCPRACVDALIGTVAGRGRAVANRRGVLPILRPGRHGRRRRQDARHGRRVSRLEARARSPSCSRRSPGRSSGSSSSWPGAAA